MMGKHNASGAGKMCTAMLYTLELTNVFGFKKSPFKCAEESSGF